MKSFPWLIVGVGLGVAVTYLVLNPPSTQYATGSDDLDDAADRSSAWGAKQRVKGTGDSVVGKLKEGFGRATGQNDVAGEGLVDQVSGAVKDTAGKAAGAVGETVHDLKR